MTLYCDSTWTAFHPTHLVLLLGAVQGDFDGSDGCRVTSATRATTLIDRVDSQDRPIGVVPRRAALSEGANFRTAHVFVFDRRGWLLLQRLAAGRERHPGRWGSSVAAYLFAGESYEEAARRRMAAELGLAGQLHALGKMQMRDEASTKFVGLFEFISDHAEISEPSHIAELRFRPLEELDRAVIADAHDFTPTFLQLYSFYRRRGERAP